MAERPGRDRSSADRHRSSYRRYQGGPDPLAPPVDLAEALEHIGEDVMAGYSPERSMREFLRRGGQDRRGLDDLAAQVARKRQELLQRHSLDGTMNEVRQLLDQAVLAERGQNQRAIKELSSAVEEAEDLIPVEPRNAKWKSMAADARLQLATTLLSLGRQEEAAVQTAAGCRLAAALPTAYAAASTRIGTSCASDEARKPW